MVGEEHYNFFELGGTLVAHNGTQWHANGTQTARRLAGM
jgi:hypothetical protein